MTRTAKTYIYGVIGAGGLVFAWSLINRPPADPWLWALYTALAVLASIVKVRLPGMDATYSLSFLCLLYGVAHLSLGQTLTAACVGAVAQCLLNKKRTSTPIQIAFSAANLIVSVGVCFFIARVWLTAGLVHYLPAVLALIACVYFIVNTVIVSGVLSLIQNKPLGAICQEWYVWSFPCYLAGVILVGLLPAPGYSVPGEAWLALLPMVYLVHFFVGLARSRATSQAVGDQPNAALPRAARLFVGSIVVACLIMLVVATLEWKSEDPARFLVYLV
jgi:hypothetical protein